MSANAPVAPMEDNVDAVYYQHVSKLPLVRRVSIMARRRLHQLFLKTMAPQPSDKVLDVGVSDDVNSDSNMLEQAYPHRENITCASLTDGTMIQRAYPGVKHVQITPHQPLPFADNSFDIVYSNAVLEHVGSAEQQRFFLRELCRVGRKRFVTVPNRLFPVEHHTCLPVIHYLPKPLFRRLLRGTRYDTWSREEYLNYVSAAELREFWPAEAPVIVYSGIELGPFSSNLVAYNS